MGGLISSDDEAKKVRKKKTSPASPSFDPDAISEVSGSSGSEPATPGNVGRASSFTPTQATQNATKTLFSQYSEILKSKPETEGFRVELVDENIYKWHVHLFNFPTETQVWMYNEARPDRDTICMEVIFPPDYPYGPPFMRIVYPRFHQYTGHITIGGSICVKQLTRSGWDSQFKLTQFVIMIRNLITDGMALIDMEDPRIDYTESQAREAFQRVAAAHGWQT